VRTWRGSNELTDGSGAESLARFTYHRGDIALADRGYVRPRDLRPVLEAGADFIARMGWNALRLQRLDGSPFDLFGMLAKVKRNPMETKVQVDEGRAALQPLVLRLIVMRKPAAAALHAQARATRSAAKHGKTLNPKSLQAANYVLLLTSLPASDYPASRVGELYRLRWQIELAFKRWKSLGELDQLPAKDPALARSWIYARLIAALLAENTTGPEPESPPLRTSNIQPQSRPGDIWRSPFRSSAPPSLAPENGQQSETSSQIAPASCETHPVEEYYKSKDLHA
jgi:hypothetical protein